jgi:hypothetical protein
MMQQLLEELTGTLKQLQLNSKAKNIICSLNGSVALIYACVLKEADPLLLLVGKMLTKIYR